MGSMSKKSIYFIFGFLICVLCIFLIHQLKSNNLPFIRDSSSLIWKKGSVDEPSFLDETRKEEPPCPYSREAKISRYNMPSTALVSFPGSGNSWTRHLLATATNVLVGAVYAKEGSYGFVSPKHKEKANKMIAVKTHLSPQETRYYFPFERCILLIRSPYDALLADFNRLGNGSGKGHSIIVPAEHFRYWPSFVSQRGRKWSKLYLGWLVQCKPPNLHVLVYSRMMHNLSHELHAVFRFLNLSNITPRVHCAVNNPEGIAHRGKHAWQKNFAIFSEQQTRFLNTEIDKLQTALKASTGQSFGDFQDWKR